jgi:hypothetical protein
MLQAPLNLKHNLKYSSPLPPNNKTNQQEWRHSMTSFRLTHHQPPRQRKSRRHLLIPFSISMHHWYLLPLVPTWYSNKRRWTNSKVFILILRLHNSPNPNLPKQCPKHNQFKIWTH